MVTNHHVVSMYMCANLFAYSTTRPGLCAHVVCVQAMVSILLRLPTPRPSSTRAHPPTHTHIHTRRHPLPHPSGSLPFCFGFQCDNANGFALVAGVNGAPASCDTCVNKYGPGCTKCDDLSCLAVDAGRYITSAVCSRDGACAVLPGSAPSASSLSSEPAS